MKKILFIAFVAAIATVSCTKDRECSCKVTIEAAGVSTSSDDKFTIKEATKGQAKANCVSTKEVDDNVTTTRDCTLN